MNLVETSLKNKTIYKGQLKGRYGQQLSAPSGQPAYGSLCFSALRQLASNRLLSFALMFVSLGLQAQNLDPNFANQGIGYYQAGNNSEFVDLSKNNNDSLYLLINNGNFDSTNSYNQNYSILKIESEGTVDNNFGNNGQFLADFGDFDYSTAQALAIDNNQNLLILGYAYNFDSITQQKACLSRISAQGTIDSSFANQGTAVIDFLGTSEYPTQLRIDAAGRYLITGVSLDTSNQKSRNEMPVLARLFADASPDSSFGGTGKILIDPMGNSPIRHLVGGYLYDALPLSNNQIMLAMGYSNGDHLQCMLILLNEDGSIDPNFANGQLSFNLLAAFNNHIVKLVELPDSSVAFGAAVPNYSNQRDFHVGRVFLNGQFTIERIDFNGNQDILEDLILTDNNELIAVGRSIHPSHQNQSAYRSDYFAAVRFPDYTDLSQQQLSLIPLDSNQQAGALSIIQQNQGRLVIGGFSYGNSSNAVLLGLQSSQINPTHLLEKKSFLAFPNPGKNLIQLQSSFDQWKLRVVDLNGRLYWDQKVTQTFLKIDSSKWPAGNYVLQFWHAGQLQKAQLWIKI